jgi:hypothetical protein
MKTELGEFAGTSPYKGFKFWYVQLEKDSFYALDKDEKVIFPDILNGLEGDFFLSWLNTRIRQAFMEKVQQTRCPKVSKDNKQVVSACILLAQQHPDGILLSQEEALQLKPWLRNTSVEDEISKIMETIMTLPADQQQQAILKLREKLGGSKDVQQ